MNSLKIKKTLFIFSIISLKQAYCISPHFVKSCKEELSRIASYASQVNSQLKPKFVRSNSYTKPDSDPTDFWLEAHNNPIQFSSALNYRLDHLKSIKSKYAEIIQRLESKNEIDESLAKEIVILESDPLYNSILDEQAAIPNFEKYRLSRFNENSKDLYETSASKFKSTSEPILELRKRLREKISLGHLSVSEAKLLLEQWALIHHETDLHPDSLPDWITGADSSLKASNNYLDPESGHQTGYGASPLRILENSLKEIPLKSGDTVLDVGSGWGRILMAGSILHPELNFSGVEFVPERAAYLIKAIEKMKVPNAQNKQMDASEAEVEPEIQKAKAIYLFNSFTPPALKLFVERTKSVVKNTQQSKYIIAANEQIFPIPLETMGLKAIRKAHDQEGRFNQYTIYKIDP